jgi:putative DNA primase/helicase
VSDAEILAALDQTQEFASGDDDGAPQRQYLEIGSDVEIAQRVATDFRQEFGEVVFADGEFWRYVGPQWQPIVNVIARRAVHLYDGALYQTAAGEPATVKLGKGRVDSVLHEMGSMLARPDFFEDAWVGINCASGFIAFDAAGQPSLLPHDPGHRCRHVLPGRWQAGSIDAEDPLSDSLLGRLLGGVFKGDEDEFDKRKLVSEIGGSAALSYAMKLRQPKAIVFSNGSRATAR